MQKKSNRVELTSIAVFDRGWDVLLSQLAKPKGDSLLTISQLHRFIHAVHL